MIDFNLLLVIHTIISYTNIYLKNSIMYRTVLYFNLKLTFLTFLLGLKKLKLYLKKSKQIKLQLTDIQ
jgi:hypothetical protein